MDVSFVNPFINSTIETCKTMLNLDVEPQKPRLKQDEALEHDISAVIGLSGNARGTIALSFTKIMALKSVSAMLGMEIKVVGEDVSDGVGELVNIIAGHAKQNLTNYELSISLPNVIIGNGHRIQSISGVPTIVVPFSCEYGEFTMEITLKTE